MIKNRLGLLFGILLFFSSLIFISADIGPHNAVSVTFEVTYNNTSIPENFNAIILACNNTSCREDNHAFCTNGTCKFNYYRLERVPQKMKLLIELNNETFNSEIIEFLSTKPILSYKIDINFDNKLSIMPFPTEESSTTSPGFYFILALSLTLIIEVVIFIIFLRRWKIKTQKWKRPLISLIIANLISLPLVWVIFFFLLIFFSQIFLWTGVSYAIFIAELFAVFFEAYFIYWLNKKIITLKKSFILSIVINVASFLIGGLLLIILLSVL